MVSQENAMEGIELVAGFPMLRPDTRLEELRAVPISVTHPYIQLTAETMPQLLGGEVRTTSDLTDILHERIELPKQPWTSGLNIGQQKQLIRAYLPLHPRVTLLASIKEKGVGSRDLCYTSPLTESTPSLLDHVEKLLDVLDITGLAELPADRALTLDNCMNVADELGLRRAPTDKDLYARVFKYHRRVEWRNLRLQRVFSPQEIAFPATTGQAFDQVLKRVLGHSSKKPRTVGNIFALAFGDVLIDRGSSKAFGRVVNADPRLVAAGQDSNGKRLYALPKELQDYPDKNRQRELRIVGRTVVGNLVKTGTTSLPATLLMSALEKIQGTELSDLEASFTLGYLASRFLDDKYGDGQVLKPNERAQSLAG